MSDQQLQAAIKAQGDIDIDRSIMEMKGSALARSNWEQLISSAPIALRCLGACFMAANSDKTTRVEVPKVAGATLDRPLDLPSNLVRCSNLGTEAFLVANKGMAEIYHVSGMSENKVYAIVDLLGNRNAAAKQLPSALQTLKANADSCYEASKLIDDSFAKWLLFVMELFEACQSSSSSVAGEMSKAITEKAVATQKVKDTKEQIETTKKSMEVLEKTVDASISAFNRASESQPSGWDIIGQEMVKGIGDSLITGINGAMKRHGYDGSSNQQNGTYGQGVQNSGSGRSPPSGTPDPAYAYVKKDLYLYDLLKPMVKNANGDIDWELASGGNKGAQGGNSGLSFIEAMLTESKTNFARQVAGGLATSTYTKVLDDAIKVVGEMSKALSDSSTDLSASRPQKGSESVVRWQTLTDSFYKDVRSLQLQSQTQAFSPSSSNGALPDPNLPAPRPDANLSHGQAVLQSAAANMKTTAETLESTSKVYGENSKMLADQQSSLMEINSTLTRLTANVISLKESKEILLQCIGLIIQLKARIVDLVDFFGMLSTVIKTVSTRLVSQWLETVKIAVTGDPNAGAAGGMIKVGQYSLESTERTMIMSGSICIAAYFSFFADVAKGWRDVSERSIFPGIELAESLSIKGDAKAKMDKLDKWSQAAAQDIKNLCMKQRQEIQDGMAERVTKVRDTLKQLPPPPAAIVEITQNVLPRLENEDIKAIEIENNNSSVKILTGKRRSL